MVLFSIVLPFFCVLIFYCFNKRTSVSPKPGMVYFTQVIFVAQFNAIFVTLKLQLQFARVNQLRFQCDFNVIYRRGLRCKSRNTVTFE